MGPFINPLTGECKDIESYANGYPKWLNYTDNAIWDSQQHSLPFWGEWMEGMQRWGLAFDTWRGGW